MPRDLVAKKNVICILGARQCTYFLTSVYLVDVAMAMLSTDSVSTMFKVSFTVILTIQFQHCGYHVISLNKGKLIILIPQM